MHLHFGNYDQKKANFNFISLLFRTNQLRIKYFFLLLINYNCWFLITFEWEFLTNKRIIVVYINFKVKVV